MTFYERLGRLCKGFGNTKAFCDIYRDNAIYTYEQFFSDVKRYMGYFHGYKGYRYHNNPNNTYAFKSFDEIQAIYDFDMAIKTMFYPEPNH